MGYLRHAGGVTQAWLDSQPLEVELAWERMPSSGRLASWYDPKDPAPQQLSCGCPFPAHGQMLLGTEGLALLRLAKR